MAKVAVVLSGSGYLDGAEIQESVITLLALDSNDAEVQSFAPDIPQMHVVNHLSGTVEPDTKRNVLQEAARIVRGTIQDIRECKASDFDAIVFTGGYGVAKNLSDFAVAGTNLEINADVLAVAKEFAAAGKPAGYMCIGPALLPKIYGEGVLCTIGNDKDVRGAIEAMGGKHQDCLVDDVVIDEKHKVVTTPAYMLAQRISEAAAGIDKLVRKVLEMI